MISLCPIFFVDKAEMNVYNYLHNLYKLHKNEVLL